MAQSPFHSQKKKVKPLPRSNSVNSTEENETESAHKPAEGIFSDNDTSQITFNQFKFFLENFGNQSINIHILCNEILRFTQYYKHTRKSSSNYHRPNDENQAHQNGELPIPNAPPTGSLIHKQTQDHTKISLYSN